MTEPYKLGQQWLNCCNHRPSKNIIHRSVVVTVLLSTSAILACCSAFTFHSSVSSDFSLFLYNLLHKYVLITFYMQTQHCY